MKGCKNCPAYAKCTVTYRGSACAALRSTYGIDSDPEIVTNADRIRAMSDEELAKFMSIQADECQCEADYKCNYKCGSDSCLKVLLDWLQQPAEEDI